MYPGAISKLQSQIGVSATPREMTYVIFAVIAVIFYFAVIKPAIR